MFLLLFYHCICIYCPTVVSIQRKKCIVFLKKCQCTGPSLLKVIVSISFTLLQVCLVPGGPVEQVYFFPVLAALKKKYPSAAIDIVASSKAINAYALCPFVRNTIPYELEDDPIQSSLTTADFQVAENHSQGRVLFDSSTKPLAWTILDWSFSWMAIFSNYMYQGSA